MSPVPVTTGEIWTVWNDHPTTRLCGRFHRRAYPRHTGTEFRPKRSVDKTITHYNELRRLHPGKRIVIAEFGWPSAGYNMHERLSRTHRAGDGAARFRVARRSLWHRLQHHRSLSTSPGRPTKAASACIGACSMPPATPSSPGRAGQRSRSLEGRRTRRAARPAAVAADPGAKPRHRPARRSRSPLPPTWSAPGSPRCSPSGRPTTSCSAPRSRSVSASFCSFRWSLIALARIEEIAAIAFGRGPRRLIAGALPRRAMACAQGVDPRSGPSRAAGDAQGDARCGRAPRLSELRMRGGHQQHARSGVLAARSRNTAARSASASSSSTRTTWRATRRVRCGWRSPTPLPTPRSSA